MEKMEVQLQENSYPIYFAEGFCGLGEALAACKTHPKIMVVTEPKIRQLFGDEVMRELAGFHMVWHEIPGGEEEKSLQTVAGIYEHLLKERFDRKSTLLALGGGIVGDITGFAAATFMRGISFVQLPTTLLAQVDSSVGGKTGVNLDGVKNVVGAFYQPKLVFANLSALKTLSDRDYASGLGEVVKYGILEGEAFFSLLEREADALLRREEASLREVVALCCQCKARIVAEDERENGIRAVLNLGHTFGHAYEAATHHVVFHGEAVGLGLISACAAAEYLGKDASRGRVTALLKKLGLPLTLPAGDEKTMLAAMQRDKKSEDGKLRFVLPFGLGDVRLESSVPPEAVRCGWEAVWK